MNMSNIVDSPLDCNISVPSNVGGVRVNANTTTVTKPNMKKPTAHAQSCPKRWEAPWRHMAELATPTALTAAMLKRVMVNMEARNEARGSGGDGGGGGADGGDGGEGGTGGLDGGGGCGDGGGGYQ